MVATGIDAARDVQVQLADLEQVVQIVELALNGFGDGDGDRVGQRAEVSAGTGDDVGQQADVGRGQVQRFQLLPEIVQPRTSHASARSATASIWSAVMSPGGTPVGLSDTLTAA
ncbi:hypothetical protein G6F23_014311 [Rhizopus arrhizus]|nr:hypothetical protein G6F23_014311 [Rhizopus arrhizus]